MKTLVLTISFMAMAITGAACSGSAGLLPAEDQLDEAVVTANKQGLSRIADKQSPDRGETLADGTWDNEAGPGIWGTQTGMGIWAEARRSDT